MASLLTAIRSKFSLGSVQRSFLAYRHEAGELRPAELAAWIWSTSWMMSRNGNMVLKISKSLQSY